MKKLSIILITISILASAVTVNAASIPRESAPCNATEHQIIVAESFISGVLDEVKNGMGFADAKQSAYNEFKSRNIGTHTYQLLFYKNAVKLQHCFKPIIS